MCDFKLIAEACTAGAPVQSTVFYIQFIFTFLVRPAPSPLGLDTGFTGWQGGIMKTLQTDLKTPFYMKVA